MEKLLQSLERYLGETLGISVKLKKWEKDTVLPFFLRDLYDFYLIRILHRDYLLMVARISQESTPMTIRKHLSLIQERGNVAAIYVHAAVTSYNRKRLVEKKIPFIVPMNQLYLPDLGIDLREHFKKVKTENILLSPSTQLVILYAIITGCEQAFTPSQLAMQLNYSRMTLTRALDEIKAAGIGEISLKGRERVLSFGIPANELWNKALPLLRNPVKKTVWVRTTRTSWPMVKAGLTALSKFSLLTPPSRPVYALDSLSWQRIRQSPDCEELPFAEEKSNTLEIWSYSPFLLAADKVADRFSLYLSLKDNPPDERVESALTKMMEAISW
jgi:hypothetical protein